MDIPAGFRFLASHEWCTVDGDVATIGISDYAQDSLGDVVYIELPTVGSPVTAGEVFGAIESVKAASDLNSPVSGEVVEVNTGLDDTQEAINKDPFGEGWLIKVKMSNPSEVDSLLDGPAYEKVCAEEKH